MAKILGLDLGTNSIGWSIIDDKEKRIVDAGVRIFQEGVNRNTSGSEVSKNASRRIARGIRRLNFRYKSRRNRLLNTLSEIGMFPEKDCDSFYQINPYEVRKKGLDEKLTLHELGRAIFHLNQRRGFKSSRKTATNEDSKIFSGGDNTIGITETSQAISKGGYRTLGEYLSSINPKEQRIRNRFTLRNMYEDEFNKLWKIQSEYYPEILTEEYYEKIHSDMFYQRKLKSQKHTISKCTFEKNKKAAPKSSPTFQYFRILEQISRIKVTNSKRVNDPLNESERTVLIYELMYRSDLKFDGVRKVLGLSEDTHINIESLGKLLGNKTLYLLASVFGKGIIKRFGNEEIEQIWQTLHFSDEESWLREYALNKWNLDEEAINKLLKKSLESGYCRLSKKALLKIIPHLEKGMTYDKAVKEAGYNQIQNKDGVVLSELPEPEDIRNPIVQQTLHELKKVVNSIIAEFGKPDIIRVELARELKLPKHRREKIAFENNKRKKRADEIKEQLQNELGFTNPSREDMQKYLLWEECRKICPYSGKMISLASLYNGDFEIEHIIPYRRSLDDSLANKTIAYRDVNREKGDKTPHEAFSSDKRRYGEILERVRKNMPNKIRKFTVEDIGEELSEEFFSRQLNDTAYISRMVHEHLKKISKKVQVVKGRATAVLRNNWGLNSILSSEHNIKNRDDHRHHAIDAMVIANTSPNMLKYMSTLNKYNRNVKQIKFPEPIDNFRSKAELMINNILVSHKSRNRARGKLHEETFYGKIQLEDGSESFVVRKPLNSLTPKEVSNIVDSGIKEQVANRLLDFGIKVDGKTSTPKEAFHSTLYSPKSNIEIKSVRIKIPSDNMIRLYGDQELFVKSGNNHHIELFVNSDSGKQVGRVVSMFEAVQRKRNRLPVINQIHPEGFSFLLAISINDLIILGIESDTIDFTNYRDLSNRLYRVQKLNINQIALRHHTIGILKDDFGKEPGRVLKTPNSFKGIKVRVDAIGKIYSYHD